MRWPADAASCESNPSIIHPNAERLYSPFFLPFISNVAIRHKVFASYRSERGKVLSLFFGEESADDG
jgi:hypothetical protein